MGIYTYIAITDIRELTKTQYPINPIPSTSTSPNLPTPEQLLKEPRLKYWANNERCPKKGFSIPSKPEDFVSSGGTRFAVNVVEINFADDATCEDVEQIAILLNGRIVGFEPVTNLYEIEIPTRTPEELFTAIDKINSLNNPKIEGVFEAFDVSTFIQ